MALLSGYGVTNTVNVTPKAIDPVPIFHPSYGSLVQMSASEVAGVQKQAAENFKWGR